MAVGGMAKRMAGRWFRVCPKALLAAALASAGWSTAHAQSPVTVTIRPSAPTTADEITVSIEEGFVMPGYGAITKAGAVIGVNYFLVGCGPVLPPFTTSTLSLGKLPAGTYRIVSSVQYACGSEGGGVALGSGPFPRGELGLTVAPSRADPNYGDLWWNPLESGWGLSVTQHESGQVFAVWFAYGSDGKPTWYVIPGGAWLDGTTFSGTVYRTSGPPLSGPFDPALVTRTVAGQGTLAFSSRDSGTFTYTIDGSHGSKPIVRQPF